MEDQRLSWYQWYSFEPNDVQLMKEHVVFLQEKVDSLEKQTEADPIRQRKMQLAIDAIKYTYGLFINFSFDLGSQLGSIFLGEGQDAAKLVTNRSKK